MLSLLKGISLDPREEVKLAYTEGTVTPYEDYPLPRVLSNPLRGDCQGFLAGLTSGRRSALTQVEGRWFKYKGMFPIPINYSLTEPFGGMSAPKSRNELEINGMLDRKYREYRFSGPLVPAADVEYDIPFGDGKIHAAVSESFGDTRLDSVDKRIVNRYGFIGPELSRKIAFGMYSWLGFSNHILKESKVLPLKDSFCLQNWVAYRIGDGFGIGRVDHGSSQINKDARALDELVKRFAGQLSNVPFEIAIKDTAECLEIPLGNLLTHPGLTIEWVSDETKEKINRKKKTIFMHRKRGDLYRQLENAYFDSYDGKTVPEPIDRELMLRLFS